MACSYFWANLELYIGFCKKRLSKDQVEDYAEWKDFGLEEAERWLAPVLNYDLKDQLKVL